MPSFSIGDNLVGIGVPGDGLWLSIMFCDETVDGGLEVHDRTEGTAPQATLCQLCEEALNRVEPRTGRWREVECEARVPAEPDMHISGVFRTRNPRLAAGSQPHFNGVNKSREHLLVSRALGQ